MQYLVRFPKAVLLVLVIIGSSRGQWVQTNLPYSTFSLATSDTNLFAGTVQGIYRSTNDGNIWDKVGLMDRYVYSIAISYDSVRTLFAGTAFGGPGSRFGGVFRSASNGEYWDTTDLDGWVQALTIFSDRADNINVFAGVLFDGVYRSTDNGTNWTYLGLNEVLADAFAVSRDNSNLFAGTIGNGVYISTDMGTNWTVANTGLLNSSVRALAFSADGESIFAGTDGGVFRSTNNGANWTSAGLADTAVWSLAVVGLNIFAGRDNGVLLSSDNGATWTDVSRGLSGGTVWSFAVSGVNLFVGVYSSGVWRRPLTEMIRPFNLSSTFRAFGSVPVSSSKTDSVEVTNTGTDTLHVSSVICENLDFTITPTSGILLPAARQKFYITFTPTGLEWKTDNVIFTHDAVGSPDTVSVTGTGISPFNISSVIHPFGSVPVFSSKTDSMEITNIGSATLTILSVVSNDSQFTVAPSSGSLPPMAREKFYITFRPISGGEKLGRIIFSHDAISSPDTVVVLGTGVVIRDASFEKGWNIMSLPVVPLDARKDVLFPSAVSSAFTYNDFAYTAKETLRSGIGYWLKFSGSQSVDVIGVPATDDTIAVSSGWNMIGSISEPLPVSSIRTDPPGLITSQFFSFRRKYVISDTIHPAKGYWLKAQESGSLILSSNPSAGALAKSAIHIIPTSELPPPTPDGDTDIEHLTSNILHEYALEQNYPNPFNPTTVIRYTLTPSRSQWERVSEGLVRVSLKVYDVLGREVATLVDGVQQPGEYSVRWNAENVPSGIYFYRLQSGKFSETRKLVLLR